MSIKNLLSLFIMLITMSFFACNSTQKTSSDTDNANSKPTPGQDYIEFLTDASITEYEGKKIWFVGKEAEMVYQHMMKSSPMVEGDEDPEKHIYIDYNNKGGQIVGYYRNFKIPKGQTSIKFYGTVYSMSGAGKGGGTHTEYYLILDKVE